jgi:hypothetical protein
VFGTQPPQVRGERTAEATFSLGIDAVRECAEAVHPRDRPRFVDEDNEFLLMTALELDPELREGVQHRVVGVAEVVRGAAAHVLGASVAAVHLGDRVRVEALVDGPAKDLGELLRCGPAFSELRVVLSALGRGDYTPSVSSEASRLRTRSGSIG